MRSSTSPSTAYQAICLSCLLSDIGGGKPKAVVLNVDNKVAISLCKNPEFHDRSKHIDARNHFIRECIEGGKINIEFVIGKEQLVGIFTKSLA